MEGSNINPPQPGGAEEALRRDHDAGNFREVVTAGLRLYGAEILGFLFATLSDESLAKEVFSQFSLDLWNGIEGFRWQSSFRTWAYTLARHASARALQDPYLKRAVPLWEDSQAPAVPLAAAERSETAPFFKTGPKERMSEIRRSLAPDDQALLILRVDRGLQWEEIAQIFERDLAPLLRRREAAKLRKRFERVKDQLRARLTGK